MNLAEICDNAKKGREYALLGNYDSSMVYYQGVLQQIQRHCQAVRDPAVRGRWQQVGRVPVGRVPCAHRSPRSRRWSSVIPALRRTCVC